MGQEGHHEPNKKCATQKVVYSKKDTAEKSEKNTDKKQQEGGEKMTSRETINQTIANVIAYSNCGKAKETKEWADIAKAMIDQYVEAAYIIKAEKE